MPIKQNLSGFFLIDKPKDWTSFDVCGFLRKKFDTKRVGHTGTLDPFATGLLVIAMGRCTKLIPFLEKAEKTYEAEIVLGKTTETLDSESEIIDCNFTGKIPNKKEIESYIKENLFGEFDQIPPAYSAIKIQGQKMYDLARKGQKVDIPARRVFLKSFEILEYQFPVLKIKLTTGAGFYVRSFARDIGTAFAGGGYCLQLRRTHIDTLDITDAFLPEKVTAPIDPQFILPNVEKKVLPDDRKDDFQNGRAFPLANTETLPNETPILLINQDKTQGIGILTHGKIQPKVVIERN